MTVRKKNQRKPARKKSPKKRKPKIKLDNRSVLLLSATIIVLCAVFLSMAFLFSAPKDIKKAETAKVESPSAEKVYVPVPEEKVSEPSVPKTSRPEKKTEPLKQQPEKKPVQKQTETEKKESSVTDAPNRKQTETPAPTRPAVKNPPVVENKTAPQKKQESPEIASVKTPEKKPLEEIPASRYNIPPAKNGATLVFIIDDGGYDVSNLKQYTGLPFPIAIAVLPKLAHSRDCAYVVRSSGQELMLHQPMQAQNLKLNPGAGAILPDMTLSEVYSQVTENISEIGPVKGLNNHEGSLITCDVMKMGAVLDAAFDAGIYFVDSRTSAQTKAPQAALERDMEILQRDVFIDDIISREEMLKQIYRGIDIANKKGKVIMIGHVDKSVKILPALLNDMYPYLKQKGYKFAFPSQIRN